MGRYAAGPAVDGSDGGGEFRDFGIGHDHAADRSADVVADQKAGSVEVFELSKHDQTMAERTHGTGIAGTWDGIADESVRVLRIVESF